MNPVPVIFSFNPEFVLKRAVAEEIIRLSAQEYEQFLEYPGENYSFIKEHADKMYDDGISHCLLITGEEHRDGVLVNSEGSDYVHYGYYVSDTAVFQYDSLSEMGERLSYLVNKFVTEGAIATADGIWNTKFKEIEEASGFNLAENPYLQELFSGMLAERTEVEAVITKEDSFEVHYCLDYCPNYEGVVEEKFESETDEQQMKMGG